MNNKLNYNNLFVLILIIVIFIVIIRKKNKKEKNYNNNNNNNKKEIRYLNAEKDIPPIENVDVKQNKNNNNNNNKPKKVKETKETFHNTDKLSFWQYRDLRAHERILNPLLPPERSFESTYGIPINIPTRESGSFQQIGALYKEQINSENQKVGNSDKTVILPLFGKPLWKGSNKWTYYVTSDNNSFVKIPLKHKGKKCDTTYGCEEIQNDDLITIPEYNGIFRVNIYDYDKPSYIPCL